MSEANYQAIQLQRFADSFRAACEIVQLPQREPSGDEVRVRNLYCGINGIFDTQIARNSVDYVKIALPTLTGVEALGVVEDVGESVTAFRKGDCVVTTRFPGGYREYNTAPQDHFIKVADDSPEWLALASTGVSAHMALHYIGQVQEGETVAVSAAAGGLGHLIVQLAVLKGCRVVAVCGGPDKGAFVKSLGAERVIDYRSESVGEVLAREYQDQLDVAIDTVSGEIYDAFLENIAQHGRVVVGGAAADLDGKPEVITAPRVAHKIYYKGASVRGFMNGLLSDQWGPARKNVFDLYEAGKLKVQFDDERFTGVEGIFGAVERLLSGRSMGKVIADLRS